MQLVEGWTWKLQLDAHSCGVRTSILQPQAHLEGSLDLLLEGNQAAVAFPKQGVDLIQGCLYQAALLAQLGVLGPELQRSSR